MGWFWNAGAARYQWRNGRAVFLARDTVLDYVQETIRQTGNATDVLAQLVSDGMLSPGDWRAMMRQYIKDEYIRQGVLGRGGRAQMAAEDWGSIGGMLKREYRYLDAFTDEVATGELSEAQIRVRSAMYINGAREAFDRADTKSAKIAGMTEERWITDPSKENCPDCLAFEAEGWKPIGYFPAIASGATQCLSNCCCRKEFQAVETAEVEVV